MFKIKKDWLVANKIIFIIAMSLMAILAVVFLFTSNVQSKIFWEVNYEVAQQFVFLGSVFVCIIPMACFGYIFPTNEKSFSGKVKVNYLPFNNKQLAWKGIKLWLVMYPIWLIVATFINVIYEYKAINSSVTTMATSFSITSLNGIILFTISKLIILSFFILIIDMQVVASMIITFVKSIKWYNMFIVQIVINLIVFFISMFVINRSMNTTQSMNWIFILWLVFFIFSLIYFLYSLRNIEKVYR